MIAHPRGGGGICHGVRLVVSWDRCATYRRHMTTETSQTLDRGLLVLEVLARADDGRTVTEIAHDLGISRTVVYRLLATLEQHALVRRSSDGRTRPGMGLLGLARTVQADLRDAALPVLRTLSETVAGTTHLWLREEEDVVTVATVFHAGSTEATQAQRVGSRRHRSASAVDHACEDVPAVGPIRWHVGHDDPAIGCTTFAVGLRGVAGLTAAIGAVRCDGQLSARQTAYVGDSAVRAAAEVIRALR